MFPYADEEQALQDVLRLSRGMTYKSAMAELPFGGGKSVIIGDPRKHKSEELLKAFWRLCRIVLAASTSRRKMSGRVPRIWN